MNEENNTNASVLSPVAKALTEQDQLANFVNSLITNSSKNNLPAERRDYFLMVMTNKLFERYEYALLGALPEESFNKIMALSDDASAEEITAIINESGVDARAVLSKTMDKFQRAFAQAEAKEVA